MVRTTTLSLLLLSVSGCSPPEERGSAGLEGVQDTLAEDSAALTPGQDTAPATDPDRPMPRDTSEEENGAIRGRNATEGGPGSGDLPPWTVGRVSSQASGPGVAMVTALDHGRNPTYDRWVVHLADGPVPGWEIEYVDRPLTLCGSGRQVQPVGDGWLRIDIEPARGHTSGGETTLEPEMATPGLEQGLRIYRTCDFEGHVQLILALRSPEPFRAFALRDPSRLVVDVRTDPAGGRP